jgi:Kef-type K+ transport system membrane component KefB/mannitol/fructose-specific phosphotransferase system IIA component (Ntr-type)
MSHADIVALFMSLGVLLVVARLLGELVRRFGQPSILGELAAGILLGPTLLGAFAPELYGALFPFVAADGGPSNFSIAFEGLTTVAIAMFLLVAGMEVDLATVWRQGKLALGVGVLGIVVPFAMGFGAAAGGYFLLGAESLGMGLKADWLVFALFFATTLSITALPVIAKTLMDLDLFRTELGMTIVAAAIFNDLAGWIIFSMILSMMGGDAASEKHLSVGVTIALTLGFTAFMLTLGRWLINRSLPWIQAHLSWPGGVLGIMMALGLLAAAFTEWVGVHAIFGSFLLGVALGDSRYLRERTRTTIEQFINFIFAPLFFASIGLKVDFVASFDVLLVVVVLVVACAGKLLGAYWAARWFGLDSRQGWVVGFGMNARGAMEIILGLLALQVGLINEQLFVALVVMALVTSAIAGPAISRLMAKGRVKQFTAFVGSKSFIPNLKAASRFEAISELAEVSGVKSVPISQVVQAVIERERVLPTGMGSELALPHARIAGMKETQVAIGISRSGIDFDSPDGSLAHIIVLLLVPADDLTTALELYRQVLGTFRDEKLRDDMKRVRNYTEFLALLAAHRGEASHAPPEPARKPPTPEKRSDLSVIIGATATGRKLALLLAARHPVWLIDSNAARIAHAQEAGLQAVPGSALDDETLEAAHAHEATRVITLTTNADINALVARKATDKFNTPNLHLLLLPDADPDTLKHLGAGILFGRRISLTDWDHWLERGELETLRIDVKGRDAAALLADLDGRGTCLPLVIERGDRALPFDSVYKPAEGDVLVALQVLNLESGGQSA